MNKLFFIIGCLLTFLPFGTEAKDPCHFSTEGTDFWFGLMENRLTGNEHYLEITVSSRKDADFTVTYGPNEILIGTFSVTANTSEIVPIDYNLLEAKGSETIENKGINLQSTDSVNVYALNYRTRSSDVAVIYPTGSLGKEYFAMCYSPHPTNNIESNTEFLIVATEDQTIVEITPSVDTDGGEKANVKFSVTLNKGQSFQVQSNNSNIPGQGDLTGSYVVADKPIAFYSGVKSTAVPYEGQSRDHLFEQIPATNTWGREFYIVPLELRTQDTYRVLAAEDSTVVTIEGLNRTEIINRGKFFEFNLAYKAACRLIASKKVLLSQYCRSQEADQPNGVGDPFMIILSPISQKINDVTFEAYRTNLVRNIFYINIISLTSELDSIKLDGKNIKSFFKPFPRNKYSFAQVRTTAGTHRLHNPNKNGGFLAYVYGFGDNNNTESYGYGVGFNLDIQLEIGGSFEPTEDSLQICNGSSVQLIAGEYFKSYLWNTGDTTSTIRVSKEKWYWVTATAIPIDNTLSGCQKTDSLYVKVLKPEIDLGNDTSVCLPGDMILEAAKGFKSYKWQDGSVSPNYMVDSTGFYSVIVTDYNLDCKATDTIHVEVIMPTLSFAPDYPVVTIEHPEIKFTNLTEGALTYSWDFGDGGTSQEMNPTHVFPDIDVYQVVLTAVSEIGCTDTLGMKVEVIPVKFFIPNAFKPDSDIPENRIFQPMLNIASVDPNNYQFRIFNRLGSTIFESRNPETGWNGTSSEQGIYVWTIQYLDIQGYEHSQKGTVMLLR
jgi:PKD repeat protein